MMEATNRGRCEQADEMIPARPKVRPPRGVEMAAISGSAFHRSSLRNEGAARKWKLGRASGEIPAVVVCPQNPWLSQTVRDSRPEQFYVGRIQCPCCVATLNKAVEPIVVEVGSSRSWWF